MHEIEQERVRYKGGSHIFQEFGGKFPKFDSDKAWLFYGVGFDSRYMESPTQIHLLRYIKGILDYDMFYISSDDPSLVGYTKSDWAGDVDDKRTNEHTRL